MRKLFAALLALVMVLSLSVGAFAVGNDSEGNPVTQPEGGPYIDVATVDVQIGLLVTGGYVSPAETINFAVELISAVDENGAAIAEAPLPTASIYQEEGVGGNNYNTDPSESVGKIYLPDYTVPGKYVYKLYTLKGNTLGMSYDSANATNYPIYLTVTVNRVNGELVRVAALRTTQDGAKVETTYPYLHNSYKAYTLTVTNTVTGAKETDADLNKVTITLTNPTTQDMKSTISYTVGGEEKTITADQWDNGSVTFTLDMLPNEVVSIKNLPSKIVWSATQEGLPEDTYEFVSANKMDGTIGVVGNAITITHNRLETIDPDTDIPVDTGIALDSMPFILMLAVAAIGCVPLVSKKRED